MPITDKFFTINIRKYLALGDDQEAGYGESKREGGNAVDIKNS